MPNWCDNTLTISGASEKLKEFKDVFKGSPVKWSKEDPANIDGILFEYDKIQKEQEKTICFNALVPVPKEMIEIGYSDRGNSSQLSTFEYLNSASDGYTWCIKNWGTKWDIDSDAIDIIEEENKISYCFETAWSPCVPFVIAVSKKFPDLNFSLSYCEMGIGFAGQIVLINGEIASEIEYDSTDSGYEDFIYNGLGYERMDDDEADD